MLETSPIRGRHVLRGVRRLPDARAVRRGARRLRRHPRGERVPADRVTGLAGRETLPMQPRAGRAVGFHRLALPGCERHRHRAVPRLLVEEGDVVAARRDAVVLDRVLPAGLPSTITAVGGSQRISSGPASSTLSSGSFGRDHHQRRRGRLGGVRARDTETSRRRGRPGRRPRGEEASDQHCGASAATPPKRPPGASSACAPRSPDLSRPRDARGSAGLEWAEVSSASRGLSPSSRHTSARRGALLRARPPGPPSCPRLPRCGTSRSKPAAYPQAAGATSDNPNRPVSVLPEWAPAPTTPAHRTHCAAGRRRGTPCETVCIRLAAP